jgi:hypothetical protein
LDFQINTVPQHGYEAPFIASAHLSTAPATGASSPSIVANPSCSTNLRIAVSLSPYESALNSASLAAASGLCLNFTRQMLALNATSSFFPSSRAFSTTDWVVSQPSESTTIIVITLAITALQTMSFILLTVVSRRSAFSADRLLSASLSSVVLIVASLASKIRNIGT